MFGRNSSTTTAPDDVVDESGTPVVETVTPEAEEGTQRIMTRRSSSHDSFADDEPVVVPDKAVVPETVVTEPVAVPDADVKRWVHVSFSGVLSIIIGTLALAATFTGLLAPLGFAAGILAIIFAMIALVSVSRPHVTGHGLLIFGALFGLVAVVLSMLVMSNDLSWLSKDTNEVTVVHNWLNDHMHWLRRF